MTTAQRIAAPAFLRLSATPEPSHVTDAIAAYQPLIGIWLIELALDLGWYRTEAPHRNNHVFSVGSPIFALIGIEPPSSRPDTEASTRRSADATSLLQRLRKRLAVLRQQPLDGRLPLFRNLELFGRLLGLSDVEKAILAFVTILDGFHDFRTTIIGAGSQFTTQQVARVLARLTGHPEDAVRVALRDDGLLVSSGLVSIEPALIELEHKISGSQTHLLLQWNRSEEQLIRRLLQHAGKATLTLAAFPHLAADIALLAGYLRNALRSGAEGVNILFYGLPGTGKTELAKALAASLAWELYEVPFAGLDGDLIDGNARLCQYKLCQLLLARKRNALVMFDEIEDVFTASPVVGHRGPLAETRAHARGGKAFINRTLERNAIPALWITNDPAIDPAYLRRFDFSIRFPIPPQKVRIEIARHHLQGFDPTEAWLSRVAANEQSSPAQIERAAKVARIASQDAHGARQCVEQVLDRSAALLGQKSLPIRNLRHTAFDLRFIQTDIAVGELIEGLRQRPAGSFCFHGVAGTGKSELARHIADEIGKPFLLRRASDLLSMWVGEAEKAIAAMFEQARREDAVLVLDEVDSFLGDRRAAQRSWEVTQVNELLTQMEAHTGIFIGTTNLMQKLDAASLRRFAFKVKFDYLTPEQRWGMYRQEFGRLGGDPAMVAHQAAAVRGLERLTPGDFAVVARQYALWGKRPTAAEFLERLRRECVAKEGDGRPMGFVG